MKIFLSVMGIIVLLVAIGVGGTYVGVFGNILTAPAKIANRTFDTNNIVNSYHEFTDRFNGIKTAKAVYDNNLAALQSYEASAGDRSTWTFEDKQEWARLNSLTLGAKNGYNELVNQYNAEAGKLDRSIFKDRSLPDHIEPII